MVVQNLICTLSLLPGDEDDDVRCTTSPSELGFGSSYSALSYVWGDPAESRSIFVDGAAFDVTTNLYQILKRLRRKKRPHRLWIDQLCIDQDDAEKKTQQVRHMRNIYKKCQKCFIWLGELPLSESLTVGDAETALELVRFCAEFGLDMELTTASPIPDCLVNMSAAQLDGLRCAFEALFRAEWWSRIWTVQEAVLPPRCVVLWGPLALDWKFFVLGAHNLCVGCHPRPVIPAVFDKLAGLSDTFTSQVRGLEFAGKQRDGMLHLMQRWRHRRATEPRDKIYALLGLLPPCSLPSVPSCDYQIPVEELYQRVTLDLLHAERHLKPLVELRPEPSSSSVMRLPSWVINFAATAPIATEAWWWDPSQRYMWYDACRGMELSSKLERDDHGTLHGLVGINIDTVQGISEILPSERPDLTPPGDLLRTIRSWKQMTQRSEYPSGCSPDEAFLRCLVGDLLRKEFPVGTPRAADLAAMQLFCDSGGRLPRLIFNSLCRLVTNQAFFTTRGGYFGVGQSHVREGDEVWVLCGSRMPFLLRPVANGHSLRLGSVDMRGAEEKGYERVLVGSCYLHGIMRGEMVRSGQVLTDIRLV